MTSAKEDDATSVSTAVTAKKKVDLIVAEEKNFGAITINDYHNFLSFSLGIWAFVIFFILLLLNAVAMIAPNLWLSRWAGADFEE